MLFEIARLVPVARYAMPVPKDFETGIARARPCLKGQCPSVPVPKKMPVKHHYWGFSLYTESEGQLMQ